MLRNSDDKTYRAYHQGEVDAAHLYGSLARAERDPAVRVVFERLAETEARHARFWAARLAAAGHAEPVAVPSRSARFLAWIARCFGPDAILPYLARLQVTESHGYDGEPDAIAADMPADDYGHARIVQAAALDVRGLPGRPPAKSQGRRRSGRGHSLGGARPGENEGPVS